MIAAAQRDPERAGPDVGCTPVRDRSAARALAMHGPSVREPA